MEGIAPDLKREKFLELIHSKTRVVVEIGCGTRKQSGDYIGIDLLPLEGVDIQHNLEEKLTFIPDNSVDEVCSSHVLEHVTQFDQLMEEIHRILKPGGVHTVTVPHFSNPYYYSDPTHKRFFGLYTFDYFARKQDQELNRKVPDFYYTFHFKVRTREYRFKTHFSPRNLLNIVFAQPFFNLSNFTKELYEGKCCYWFPAYEIRYTMEAVKA